MDGLFDGDDLMPRAWFQDDTCVLTVLLIANVIITLGLLIVGIRASLVKRKQRLARPESHFVRLNEELAAAYAEVEMVNEQLARVNDDLEQFAYAASHDLQEPLRTIASLGTMLRTAGPPLDERSSGWLDRMILAAARMSTMVDGLLSFSRSGRGLRRETVYLDAVFMRALDLLRQAVEEREVAVDVGPLFAVDGDPDLLTLAAKNLLSNAVKYSPPGARVRVYAEGRTVYVEDQGEGIPQDKHERIFEMFTRNHGGEVSGNGIGLALVRRIATHHQAAVCLSSRPGRGSVFGLDFEAADDDADVSAAG